MENSIVCEKKSTLPVEKYTIELCEVIQESKGVGIFQKEENELVTCRVGEYSQNV